MAAGEVGAGVQVVKFDGSLVAEAVFQAHFGQVVAFEAETDVLVAGVGAFGRGQYVVDAAGGAVFFQGIAGGEGVFIGEDGGGAVADGLVLRGFGDLRQINVIEPNVAAVAYDGLFVGAGIFPFEEAGSQDAEAALGVAGFVAALHALAEAAADAVGVGVEFLQGFDAAGLGATDGHSQNGCGGQAEGLGFHRFSFVRIKTECGALYQLGCGRAGWLEL